MYLRQPVQLLCRQASRPQALALLLAMALRLLALAARIFLQRGAHRHQARHAGCWQPPCAVQSLGGGMHRAARPGGAHTDRRLLECLVVAYAWMRTATLAALALRGGHSHQGGEQGAHRRAGACWQTLGAPAKQTLMSDAVAYNKVTVHAGDCTRISLREAIGTPEWAQHPGNER